MSRAEKENYFTNRVLYETALWSDKVVTMATELPAIDTSTSAMARDPVSTCYPIHCGMELMIQNAPSGPNSERMDYYMCNPITGERLQISSLPAVPRPKKLLYIGDGNFINDAVYCVRQAQANDRIGRTSRYSPDGLVYQKGSSLVSLRINPNTPMWFVSHGVGILLQKGMLGAVQSLYDYRDGDYVDDEAIQKAHASLVEILEIADFQKYK